MKNLEPPSQKPLDSLALVGARVTWMMAGPLALLLLAVGIVTSGSGWLTWLDALFGIVVVLMILGRTVEHRSGAGTTASGEPSTADHYRRYVVGLVPFSLIAWVLANLVGNHFLSVG